ncbi:hypothetical protein BX265_5290 [Streptomyces sp. TLI_235]|nr:hypothetical protein [Streptomyces sp. TLI_235]PBC70735.1 hypothetical protein BX265_5290 [Streptomyces sp. TLI_235]
MSVTRTLRTAALAAFLATASLAAAAPQASALGEGSISIVGGQIVEDGTAVDVTVSVSCPAGDVRAVFVDAIQGVTGSFGAAAPQVPMVTCTGSPQDVVVRLAASPYVPGISTWQPGTAYVTAWLSGGATDNDLFEEIVLA